MTNLPRGLRNNNPLNIKYSPSNKWQGKILDNTDGEFEQFETLVYGFRAALFLIRKYMRRYGFCSVRAIVHRWCPDATADSYVSQVCYRTGLAPSDVIVFEDKELMIDLVLAMAGVENGFDFIDNEELYPIVLRAYSLV